MLSLILAALIAQAPPPKPQEPAPKPPAMVPDPAWWPRVGDRSEVGTEGAPACVNLSALTELKKYDEANDAMGLEEMVRLGKMARMAKGTRVLVLTTWRPSNAAPPPRPAEHFSSTGAFVTAMNLRQLDAAAARRLQPDWPNAPLEVRILDGPLAGQRRFTLERFIVHMVPAQGRPVAGKPLSPQARRLAEKRRRANAAIDAMVRPR